MVSDMANGMPEYKKCGKAGEAYQKSVNVRIICLHISSYPLHIQQNLSMLAFARQIAGHVRKVGVETHPRRTFGRSSRCVERQGRPNQAFRTEVRVQPVQCTAQR